MVSGALRILREGIDGCLGCHDDGSRELFEEMLVDEEEHLHWLDVQRELIGTIGAENYLASQM